MSTHAQDYWTAQRKLGYISGKIGLIPAFGDEIGKDVNKAELAVCGNMAKEVAKEHAELFSAFYSWLKWEEANALGYCAKELESVSRGRYLEQARAAITRAKGEAAI